MTWKCDQGGDKPTHVYPLNDLKEHCTDSVQCWCNPRVEWEGMQEIIIHNSADGRDKFETGERLRS